MVKNGTLNRSVIVILAILLLASGCITYLLFRPTTMLMFRWIDFIGAKELVDSFRIQFAYIYNVLPSWMIYSLPFALWTSASMLLFRAIWWKTKSRLNYFWFWCIPFTAIGSELLQLNKKIPGSYDTNDLFALCASVVLVVLFCKVFTPSDIYIERKAG